MKARHGALIAIVAAILWGFSGTCGQYIFDTFNFDASYLTSIRMLSAGSILVIFGLLKDRPVMTGIWNSRKTAVHLLVFAVLGLMLCQLSYMKAIQHTNSGTATILQYTGPVMIMMLTCAMEKRLPAKKEVVAIIMALLGTFLLATHGDIHTMVITPLGLIWGILAAVTLVAYTMIPTKLITRFGSTAVTGYGMVIGGIFLSFITKLWEADFPTDIRFYLAFAGIVIFGTVLAYTMYLYGVTLIGPVKASMIASIEPVAATVFMIVWLKESFHYMDFFGFLCIFTTIFLLLKKEE